jgi:hypothetical protein
MLRPRRRLARILGVSPLTDNGETWYRGAVAELAVGRLLSHLDERWIVLHAVPVGRRGADIDHVVVGPPGVFTINTKNHSGQRVWVAGNTFMVAGARRDHIRNSEFEAARVVKLFGAAFGRQLPVRALIVVLNPARLHIKTRPKAVDVLASRDLLRWLKRRPAVLSSDELVQVDATIGLHSTWRRDPDEQVDLDRRSEFKTLQALIRRTRLHRRIWLAGVLAAVVAAAVWLGPEVLQLAAGRFGMN